MRTAADPFTTENRLICRALEWHREIVEGRLDPRGQRVRRRVAEVAYLWEVDRRTVHAWLARVRKDLAGAEAIDARCQG